MFPICSHKEVHGMRDTKESRWCPITSRLLLSMHCGNCLADALAIRTGLPPKESSSHRDLQASANNQNHLASGLRPDDGNSE
jgi:hypothetical protein